MRYETNQKNPKIDSELLKTQRGRKEEERKEGRKEGRK